MLKPIAQSIYKDEDEDEDSDAEPLLSEESSEYQDESGDGESDCGDDRSHRPASMSTAQKSSRTTIPNCWDSQNSSRFISPQSQAATSSSAGSQRSSDLTQRESLQLVASYSGKLPRPLPSQRDMHFALANASFNAFSCTCQFAQGLESCLDSAGFFDSD